MLLPGSWQGPSDPETMFMDLNEEKTAYIEHWKPIEEVKEIYLKRFSDLMADEMTWHYPKEEHEDKLLDFMNGKCSWEEVDVEDSLIKTITRGYGLLIRVDKIDSFLKHIETIKTKIKEASTIETVIDVYDTWHQTQDEEICEDCIDFRIAFADSGNMGASRQRQILNGIWSSLGRECATDEFDRIVKIFDIENDDEEPQFTGTLGDNLLMCRQDFGIRIGADVKDKTALDVMNHVVHGFWMPVDRSGTLETPGLKMIGPPIPDATGFNKTLEDCMLEEAQRLWDTNRQLRVYWSGGIDSTGVLVALMRTAKGDDLDRLTMCYTGDDQFVSGISSLTEYKLFFEKFIDGKLNVERIHVGDKPQNFYSGGSDLILSSSASQHLAKSAKDEYICVTGELGDQLFGSAAFGNDNDLINATSKEFLKGKEYQEYIDDIEKFNDACPISTEKLTDMLWWWNFAIKWCEVRFRASLSVEDGSYLKNVIHFYDTENFQKWSISNPDKKIKKTEQSYKWLLKDFIYDYTKDTDYRDNKVKVGSLGVRIGHIAAIDDNYNIIKFGKMSSYNNKMKQRYGETLSKFVRDK